MNQSLKKLGVRVLRKGALVTFLASLSCVPSQATEKADDGLSAVEKNLSTLSLQDNINSLSSKKASDPFSWQNAKHYESVVKIFEDLSGRELKFILKRLIKTIHHEKDFFDRNYGFLLSHLRTTVYDWMIEDVLTEENYSDECNQPTYTSSSESDEEEDGWRRAYKRGYENDVDSDTQSDSDQEQEDEDQVFNNWKLFKIQRILELDIDSIDDFTKEDIDVNAIKIFLKNYCRSGDMRYSWLLNEIIEGSLSTSEDFVSLIYDKTQKELIRNIKAEKGLRIINENESEENTYPTTLEALKFAYKFKDSSHLNLEDITIQYTNKERLTAEEFMSSLHQETNDKVQESIGIPREALDNIFGGFWFYYDWEEFEIDDPDFIQKTYIKTLNDMKKGETAPKVKKRLLGRIQELFSFNQHDFQTPLKDIRERYNEYNKKKDWLGALVEWSVYSTYRKVFANPAKRSEINHYETTVPTLPVFQSFNSEEYLLRRLREAHTRAHAKYTKVYPHPDTKKIVFGPPHPNRAELDLQKALGEVRGVGNFLERHRNAGTKNANVFVPELYFTVSLKPNQTSPSDGQQFFHVPLSFEGLPRRPLTRAVTDGVFAGVTENEYFRRVKTDVVNGKVLQGKNKEESEAEISNLINGAKISRDQLLIHSERGVIHSLRQPANIKKICRDFANLLMTSCGKGVYTVHGAAMLAYSTNTVCPCCTPTLIALQNSHEEGGFLNLLVQELNKLKGDITFNTAGYNVKSEVMDWTQFRLNTFVTAKINFDSEADDLAEEGQHCSGKVKKSPPTHNPHAKLFFPNDEIDISEPMLSEDDMPDPYQRFFYEFVGTDMHVLPLTKNPHVVNKELKFPGAVFSSGSKSWGRGIMR